MSTKQSPAQLGTEHFPLRFLLPLPSCGLVFHPTSFPGYSHSLVRLYLRFRIHLCLTVIRGELKGRCEQLELATARPPPSVSQTVKDGRRSVSPGKEADCTAFSLLSLSTLATRRCLLSSPLISHSMPLSSSPHIVNFVATIRMPHHVGLLTSGGFVASLKLVLA